MASITTWVRLEPRARDADLVPGVEARLHDPLWLLARQWQFGELDGRDAGSAARTRTQIEVARLDAVRVAGADWQAFDPDRTPLDAALAPSRNAATARPPLHRRSRNGRQLARVLAASEHAAVAADFVTRFPLAVSDAERTLLDDADLRFLAVLAGRVPDGDAAAAWLRTLLASGDLPGDLAPASATCRSWLIWVDAFEHTAEASGWQPDRLTYSFEARAAAPTCNLHLFATDHPGGAIPWHAVDASVGDSADRPPATVASTNIPASVRYRGMPARRYWELEDAAVHWPAIDAGPGDVARLLFVEFGLTFADDWLVVPIEVPSGSVSRVASVVVTDTFGVRSLVRAAAELDGPNGPWHFAELSRGADLTGPLLFLPPAAGNDMVGPPLDTIDFARDEMSNVVWGIERVRRGADGRPRDVAPVVPVASPPPGAPVLAYRVGPLVPEAWHPYITCIADHGPELARARVPGASPSSRPEIPERLAVTAVSPRPRRLSAAFSLARCADGSYHLVMQRNTISAGDGRDQDLRFDQLVEQEEP